MEDNEKLYLGTTAKYLLEITGDGFDMSRDDFEIVLKGTTGSLLIKKKDAIADDGKFYIYFDSRRLGPGKVRAVVTAFVPDADVPSGIRNEVYVIDAFAHIYSV